MPADANAFSKSYATARDRFVHAARDAGLAITSYPLPLPGRDGETLAIDVARQGPREARSLLMLSSGTHGVEGYAGSGAQTALLLDAAWMSRVEASGVAVLYVHALNPYGFSHVRRVTHENVDLNRNFQDFGRPPPANPAYCELHPLLLPPAWPPTWRNRAAIAGLIVTRGLRTLQTALTAGQYERPDGMFFGGTEPTWSHRALRRLLREHAANARRLAWIDLHTGLGRSGRGERGFMGVRGDSAGFARANAWWGKPAPVVHLGAAESVSARLVGLMWTAATEECPAAEFTGIYMEFGTQPRLSVLRALRGDHWLHQHPQAPPALATRIKQQLFDAFFVDTRAWKRAVVSEVRAAAGQALDRMSQ
jgi:Protein of unknown function (DUF2817)